MRKQPRAAELRCAVVLRGQAKASGHQTRAPHWLLHKADGLVSAPATTEQQLEEAALLFGEALQLDGATPYHRRVSKPEQARRKAWPRLNTAS